MDKLTQLVLLLEERIELEGQLSKTMFHIQSVTISDLTVGGSRHYLYWSSDEYLEKQRRDNLEIDELTQKLDKKKKLIAELKKELAPVAA